MLTPHQPSSKPPLIVLIGPTAVGKTKLSLEIAHLFNCEIISGDSMQVYRGMDIGTAKASPREREFVPHHLIDIRGPEEPFSAADFQDAATAAIHLIQSRGHIPFIVGGTGLYIESLCYGFQFSEGGADDSYRQELNKFAELHGDQALHDRLRQSDPSSAERIHPNNRRRVIRALEILHTTGISMTDQLQQQTRTSPYQLCVIGLTMGRDLLYSRIEERIDQMLEEGLLFEVQSLLKQGCNRYMISMQGLGYKEIISYLRGECTWDEAVKLLKQNTRKFAKRQMSWFRHMQDINWVDVSDVNNFSAHLKIISDIIAGKFHQRKEYTTDNANTYRGPES